MSLARKVLSFLREDSFELKTADTLQLYEKLLLLPDLHRGI